MKELPQPFQIKDIQEAPKAVFIAFLIGLLLVLISLLGTVFYRRESAIDDCEDEKRVLIKQMLDERQERITLYESLIFYKSKTLELQKEKQDIDSLYKAKTETLVKKILK